MSLTSVTSARPGSFGPAISHGAATAASATVTTQADGRFVVEPARPDDSLFALLRTADTCLGRPVERLGGLLSNIVSKLFAFGPVGADAAHMSAGPANQNGARDDDFIETVIPPEPEASPVGTRTAAQPVPHTAAKGAGFDPFLVTFLSEPGEHDIWDGHEARMKTIERNLIDSVRAAVAESPATADLVTRALRHTEGFAVFAPDTKAIGGASTVSMSYYEPRRVVLVGPWFDAQNVTGQIIRTADQIAAAHESGRYGPRRTDRAALESCAQRVLDSINPALICLTQGPELPPTCQSALRLAATVEHRRIDSARRTGASPAEIVRSIRMLGASPAPGPLVGFTLDPLERTLDEHDAETASIGFAVERDGNIERLTPARIKTAVMPTPRGVTADEARLAHLYQLSTLIADQLYALHRPQRTPVPDWKLRQSLLAVMPLDTLRQTCPTVFLTPPEATGTSTKAAKAAQALQSRRA